MKRVFCSVYLKTALLALLLACVIFLPFFIADGFSFFMPKDYITQYVTFGESIADSWKSGSLSFMRESGLGGSFFGTQSYYGATNPFTFIYLIFPSMDYTLYLSFEIVITLMLSALFAAMFMRRYVKNDYALICGALLYAFSGFTVSIFVFCGLLYRIMLFPILLFAIDELIQQKRRGLVLLTVFLVSLSDYTSIAILGICGIIYFVAGMNKQNFLSRLKSLPFLFGESLIGILLCSFVLFPSVINALDIPRIQNGIDYSSIWTYIHYPINFIMLICAFILPPETMNYRSVLPETSYSNVEMWLPLVGCLLVVAFFLQKENRKTALAKNLYIYGAIMISPLFCSVFTLFRSSGFSSRWMFAPVLFLALASVKFIDNYKEAQKKSLIKALIAVTCLFVSVMLGSVAYKFVFGVFAIAKLGLFILYCAIALVGVASTALMLIFVKKHRMRLFVLLICVFAVVSAVFNIYLTKTTASDFYDNAKETYIDIADEIKLPEGEYRISTPNCIDNTSVRLRAGTTDWFSSTVTGSIHSFYRLLGESDSNSRSLNPDWYVARSFLSVKYLVTPKEYDVLADKQGLIKYEETEHYNIYSNTCCLPFGLTYDYYITREQWESVDVSNRQKLLTKAVLLDDSQIAEYKNILQPLSNDMLNDLSFEAFTDEYKTLSKNSLNVFTSNNNGFSATLYTETERLAVFQIPYESGYKAEINGKSTEVIKVFDGMCALVLPKGYNEIIISYTTPGLRAGVTVSLISFAAGILYLFFAVFRVKARK